MLYYVTAYTTLISAVLGLVFSLNTARREKGSRENALYLSARSLALLCISLIPIRTNTPGILTAATAAMLIVQTTDAFIGIYLKNKIRTIGPFIMAACHAICLLLYSA